MLQLDSIVEESQICIDSCWYNCLPTFADAIIFIYTSQYILTQTSSDTWYVVCYHSDNRSKKSRFSFSQERVLICLCNSPFWGHFSQIQHGTGINTPGVLLSFSQNKNIKIARFKGIQILYKEWFSQLVSRYTEIETSQYNWEIRPLHLHGIKPWRRVLHFNEIVLIVTFNGNSIEKCNPWKLNVRDFLSVFTILSNGYNDNEAVLKKSQNNFDRHIENGSSKISISLIQTEIIWDFHKFKRRL